VLRSHGNGIGLDQWLSPPILWATQRHFIRVPVYSGDSLASAWYLLPSVRESYPSQVKPLGFKVPCGRERNRWICGDYSVESTTRVQLA